MNLFLNALIVYFIPIFIYTIGKNEYIENSDEHRLNQRTVIETSPDNCTEHRIEIALTNFSWKDYFFQLSGSIRGGDATVYYLKTYRSQEVSDNLIIQEGKYTIAKEDQEFTISIRDQGVHSIFLLAEEALSHCHSTMLKLIDIAHRKERSNHLHLWNPQLRVDGDICFIVCSLSAPSQVFYRLERIGNQTDHKVEYSRFEIQKYGYYGGSFADEASLYVGSLSDSGEYHLWIVLVDESSVSDVYYHKFAIPSCYLTDTVNLFSSKSGHNGELMLSVSVQASHYPVVLTVLSEYKDKHGVRPSIDTVLQQGTQFSIFSSDPAELSYQSSIQGNQILWMVVQSESKKCYSNLFRFIASLSSTDPHPISLSTPLLIPRSTDSGIPHVIDFTGIISFPEKISESHQPFCDGYYSFSQVLPTPISLRRPLDVRLFLDYYRYHCSVAIADVAEMNVTDSVHLSVEESVVNQSHRSVSKSEILSCLAFRFSLEIAKKEGDIYINGQVSEESEIIEFHSEVQLEAEPELEVLFHGSVIAFETHQYFVLKIQPSLTGYYYFIARNLNCLSPIICYDVTKESFCVSCNCLLNK